MVHYSLWQASAKVEIVNFKLEMTLDKLQQLLARASLSTPSCDMNRVLTRYMRLYVKIRDACMQQLDKATFEHQNQRKFAKWS